MTEWTIPAKSMNGLAVSSGSADGSTIDLGEVMGNHGCQVVINLTSFQVIASLELSLNGTDWIVVASYTTTAGAPVGTYTAFLTSQTPARYVRASANDPSGSATCDSWHTSTP